jgi:transcriptional regulator with XRE-family HTH domain
VSAEVEYTYEAVEFGKRLREIRKKCKYTQEQLAEKLFLSTDSISNYENGKTKCMPENVTKIYQILNISADYLYFGIEKEFVIEKSTKIEEIMYTLQNCSEFNLDRINSMIQILVHQPAA